MLSPIDQLENSPPPLYPFGDDGVRNTNDDAASGKLSSVERGYYKDDYLHYFVKKKTRRAPLINRGYYTRVVAIRQLISQFFADASSDENVQIISFGGGFDTTQYWVQGRWSNFVYFDVDFPEVVARKTSVIAKNEKLWSLFTQAMGEIDGVALQTEKYRLVPSDIRHVADLEKALLARGFDPKLPTLMLFECVLVYMQSINSDAILKWASSVVTSSCACIVYEPVNPKDPFGSMMVHNLEARGCPLLGIFDYPTVESQINRYTKWGWNSCNIADMNEVYDFFINRADRERIEKLELFDEIEEWRLMQSHYMIVVAVNDHQGASPMFKSLQLFGQGWSKSTQNRATGQSRESTELR